MPELSANDTTRSAASTEESSSGAQAEVCAAGGTMNGEPNTVCQEHEEDLDMLTQEDLDLIEEMEEDVVTNTGVSKSNCDPEEDSRDNESLFDRIAKMRRGPDTNTGNKANDVKFQASDPYTDEVDPFAAEDDDPYGSSPHVRLQ